MKNPERYPENWAEIALDVKERAHWRMLGCGAPNSRKDWRILTVHHLDGNPKNCSPDNLVALCQRCHLRIQARYRPIQTTFDFAKPDWMRERGL